MSAATLREDLIAEFGLVTDPGRAYQASEAWSIATQPGYSDPKAFAECISNAVYAEYGSGFAWQKPVADRWDASSGLPSSPSTGDRYLCIVAGNGWTANYIYEWSGTVWIATAPASGMMVWVEDESQVYVYTGSAWEQLGTTVRLDDLTDVAIGTPSAGQVIRYDGATWANSALAHTDLGGVTSDQHHNQAHALTGADHTASGLTTGHFLKATGSGSFAFEAHGLSADDLGDVTISSPATAQILRYNGSTWVNARLGHADLGSVSSDQHHNQVHDIEGSDHSAAGLTIGHFLKAKTSTTYGFEAHGLTASDVGAEVPLAFSAPLARAVDTISLSYDATNLDVVGGELTTVQDIDTTASPEFVDVIAGHIRRDTVNNSDTAYLYLSGGGGYGATRGGSISLWGNEYPVGGGNVVLVSGFGGKIRLSTDAGDTITAESSGVVNLPQYTANKVLCTGSLSQISTDTSSVTPEFAGLVTTGITTGTSDGSDNVYLGLSGGGAVGNSRGGGITLYGNEHGSYAGDVRLRAGGVGSIVLGTDAGDALTVDADGDITLHQVTASKVLGTNASSEITTVETPQFTRLGVGAAADSWTAINITPSAVSNEAKCYLQGNGNIGFRMGYASNQTDEAAHFLTLNAWSYNDSTGGLGQDDTSYVSLMEYWQADADDADSGWWWTKASAGATAWSSVASLTADGRFSVDTTVVDTRYHGTPDASGSWRTVLSSGDYAVQFWLAASSSYVSALEISDSHAKFNVTLQTTTAVYFGDPSTDGSWRLVVGGIKMYLQRLESGSWTTKDSWL